MSSICIVSRELYPFGGAGIGVQVAGTLRALATSFEVTVLTTASHRAAYERARDRGELPAWLENVQVEFVEEPAEPGEYYTHMHAYSARVFERLREIYPRRGPDLIEFPDYLGEGLVTIQAKHAQHPWVRRTIVAVRIYTTAEICAVLDGNLPRDFETICLIEAERFCLRHADLLMWAGGDVLESYRRFYGAKNLARPIQVRHAIPDEELFVGAAPDESREETADAPLRFLYMGRLERRKGVENLVEGLLSTVAENWQLTLVGRDTDTGPLGTSLREQLELYAAGDPRVRFLEGVDRSRLPELLARHDLLVCPSLWENWPTVVLEAFATNRPLLATPVGGLVEMARTENAGWLSRGTDAFSIAEAAEKLVREPGAVRAARQAGRPRRAFAALADPTLVRRGYERLLETCGSARTGAPPPLRVLDPNAQRGAVRPTELDERRDPPRVSLARPTEPLISVVIPYFRMHRYVEEAVRSALAQTHRRIEIVLVCDGSFDRDDAILEKLAHRYGVRIFMQRNQGLGAARNAGIEHARGRYVLPLDPDDLLEPRFVDRTLGALSANPKFAYATTWSLYVDESGHPLDAGYQPIGNELSQAIQHGNVAGAATALIPLSVFHCGFSYNEDLGSYEDWDFYARLADSGMYGCVVPERLFRYRVRRDSMLRTTAEERKARLEGELNARRREARVRWKSKSG